MVIYGEWHGYDTDVAKEVGFFPAIVFTSFCIWVESNAAKNQNLRDGKYWTYNTVEALQEYFPEATKDQIRRAVENLVKKNFLEKGYFNNNPFDRKTWYTIGENGIKYLDFKGKKNDLAKMPNANGENTKSEKAELPNQKRQNCQIRNGEITKSEMAKMPNVLYTNNKEHNNTDISTDNETDKDVSSSLSSSQRDIEYNEIKDEEIKEILNSKLLTPKQVKALLIRINKTSLCGYVEKAQQYISEGGKYRDVFSTFSKWADEDTAPKPDSTDPIGEQIAFKRRLIESMKILGKDTATEEQNLKSLENQYGDCSFDDFKPVKIISSVKKSNRSDEFGDPDYDRDFFE